LSGKDADAFLRQISDPVPNALAQAAVLCGRSLAEEYLSKGYVALGRTVNWSLDKLQVLDLDKFAHNLVIPAKAGTHSDMQLN